MHIGNLMTYLREQFELRLKGPGITWNKDDILSAFDRAAADTAFLSLGARRDDEQG